MSLIEEALRRVQEAPKNAPPVAKPAKAPPAPDAPAHSWPVAPTPTASTPKPGSSPQPITRLILVGVLVGIVAWWWREEVGRKPSAHQQMPPSNVQAQSTTPLPPAPPLPKHSSHAAIGSTMVLSGVVVGVGAPYAVIDGRIVGLGEQVGEATVKEITQSAVTLRLADGSERILQVPR